MKKNVLIFPCGTEIANEVISSLQHNKSFNIVFASSNDESFCSFRGKEIHRLPYVTDVKFLEQVNSLLEKKRIDFIVPAHDDVAYTLSELQSLIKAKVIGQSFNANKVFRYKDKTYEYFATTLPIGKLYSSELRIDKFPVFVKPKKGQGSLNAFSINNEIEYLRFTESYNAKDFVIMEKFTGEEYTIDCFSNNGEVIYAGARTRDKTLNGISIISRSVGDPVLNTQFLEYAKVISKNLELHGLWFYQMKKNNQDLLRLLEIAPRVSGTMMVNRARGINFIELALYQAMGFSVEASFNTVEVAVGRSLAPVYLHSYSYSNLYVDFDDSLFIDESYINTELIKLIFQCKNKKIPVHLITKNKKNNLAKSLHAYGISHIFDSILHLTDVELKKDYMQDKAMLIDDSFSERQQAIDAGFFALGVDAVKVLIEI